MLSDAVPVGNLDAVVEELHADCVGLLPTPFDAKTLRTSLNELRVRCFAG